MINGLDLFSGIGGISNALKDWVRPIAYCEIDRYAQAVLLSRMACGDLQNAPIWDDISTLRRAYLPNIDIIYGGFPCQDISAAGHGIGLEGKRSGLFFEILRLVEEIKPTFVFLENVPAIRARGAERVGKELSQLGYDCRWETVSAEEVGAPHQRQRWFLLANSNRIGLRDRRKRNKEGHAKADHKLGHHGEKEPMANTDGIRLEKRSKPLRTKKKHSIPSSASWWEAEPSVGRVVNGLPYRMDRLKGLGNAVVPSQAREAFTRLMGIK